MLRKYTKLILISLMILSLAACGSAHEYLPSGYEITSETESEADTAGNPSEYTEETSAAETETSGTETAPALYNEETAREYYPYYTALEDRLKPVYMQMDQDIRDLTAERNVESFGITADDVYLVTLSICCDHPEYFWFCKDNGDGTYQCYRSYSYNDGTCSRVEYSYNALADDLETNRQIIENRADEILSPVLGLSAPEIEKYVHDYLTLNIRYGYADYNQCIYSALAESETVCAGFSRTFQYLMMRAGIPCYYVTGTAVNKDGSADHSWNIIKLNGESYEIDVTWDKHNNTEVTQYLYYNLSTDEISGDHTRDAFSGAVTLCSPGTFSFENLYGASRGVASCINIYGCDTVVNSLDEYTALHRSASDAAGPGSFSFSFIVNGTDVYQQIEDYLNGRSYDSTYLAGRHASISWTWYSCIDGICYVEQTQEQQ